MDFEKRKPFTADVNQGAGGATTALAAALAGHTHYVTQVMINISTAGAGAITVQDDTGIIVASLAASAAVGPYRWEFPDGKPVTAGEQLKVVVAAGPVCSIHVEGFTRQTSVLTVAESMAR